MISILDKLLLFWLCLVMCCLLAFEGLCLCACFLFFLVSCLFLAVLRLILGRSTNEKVPCPFFLSQDVKNAGPGGVACTIVKVVVIVCWCCCALLCVAVRSVVVIDCCWRVVVVSWFFLSCLFVYLFVWLLVCFFVVCGVLIV